MRRTAPPHLAVSRRSFLGGAVGAGTWLGGTGLLPTDVLAAGDDHDQPAHHGEPKAIPGGIGPFAPFGIFIRHMPPTPGVPVAQINEPSQITDFDGFVGLTRIRGGGVGTNTSTGEVRNLAFQADMGFNQGAFIGTDGRRHKGTFAFV
jgi:hypothetical protein